MGSIRNLPAANVHVCLYRNNPAHGNFPGGAIGSDWMYLSSSFVQFACSSGLRYMTSQSASHINPSAPVNKKAQRQPQFLATHGTNSGVIIAPTLVPALKIPVASA